MVPTISFAPRVRTEVLARSLLHCWALSHLVSCAQRPGTTAVSPGLTKRNTSWDPLLDTASQDLYCCLTWKTHKQPNWSLWPNLLWTSCRFPNIDQTSSQQLRVFFGWSTKEDEVQKAFLWRTVVERQVVNVEQFEAAVLCGSNRTQQKRLRLQCMSSCRKVEWTCSSRDKPFRLRARKHERRTILRRSTNETYIVTWRRKCHYTKTPKPLQDVLKEPDKQLINGDRRS